MKRSIKSVGMTFGLAALLPLAAACSHKPAQAPSSEAPSANEPGASTEMTPPAQPGAMGQQTAPAPAPQPPGGERIGETQPNAAGQPQQQGLGSGVGAPEAQQAAPPQQAAPGQMPLAGPAGENEKMLCNDISTSAKLRVEDVQNGVAIVLVPRAGKDLATVKDEARRLEGTMRNAAAHEQAAGGVRETCGLAELGRLPNMTTTIIEGPRSARIVMTTTNGAEVKDLRRMARDEVNDLNKAGKQK